MRTRELALRLATGASSGRLLRQLLTETLVLFVLGAAAGLFVAYVAIEGLTGFFATGRRPILLDVQFDWRMRRIRTRRHARRQRRSPACGRLLRALRIEPQTAMKGAGAAGLAETGGASRAACRSGRAVACAARRCRVVRANDDEYPRRRSRIHSGQVLTMSVDPALPRDTGPGAARAGVDAMARADPRSARRSQRQPVRADTALRSQHWRSDLGARYELPAVTFV